MKLFWADIIVSLVHDNQYKFRLHQRQKLCYIVEKQCTQCDNAYVRFQAVPKRRRHKHNHSFIMLGEKTLIHSFNTCGENVESLSVWYTFDWNHHLSSTKDTVHRAKKFITKYDFISKAWYKV